MTMNKSQSVDIVFSSDSLKFLRSEIEAVQGKEVLFLGTVTPDKKISLLTVVARGNLSSAPAILKDVRYGKVLIHNHPSGQLEPSDMDIQIASYIGELGAGFIIINNKANQFYTVVPPSSEEKVHFLDPEEVLSNIRPGSSMSTALESYEERKEQIEMTQEVVEAFNSQKIALIEAGTGIGKSIAYLVPSILWALKNGERVVVSTNTINLQEQLIFKDIPFLQKTLGNDFKAVLVKGRGNYACRRKAAVLMSEGAYLFENKDSEEEKALLNWLEKTKDGSRSDLNFIPKESNWEKIVSESDLCLRARCQFYNICFFYMARRGAASSDILIANHHLLFADIAVKGESGVHNDGAILPPFKRLIVDEAHNVEAVATEYFGGEVSKRGTLLTLGRLVNRKDRKKGLIPYLSNKLLKDKQLPKRIITSAIELINSDLLPSLDKLQSLVPEFFDYSAYMAAEIKKDKAGDGEEENNGKNRKIRITDHIKGMNDWSEIEKRASSLLGDIRLCLKALTKLITILKEGLEENNSVNSIESQMLELNAYSRRLTHFMALVETFFYDDNDEMVRWINLIYTSRGMSVKLYISPLSISETMNKNVYNVFKTVVLTSATLSVGGKFDYIKERIGLSLAEGKRLSELLLASPFDFRKQAFVSVPTDLPSPKDKGFKDGLVNLISQSLTISDGRAFVLFTSYKLLNETFNKLNVNSLLSGYKMMKQGEEPRHVLLQRFKHDKKSIIFGTHSFWEGVDVPGDALMNVIITKLPFSVPDTPVIEARTEMIEKKGGNAFMDYLLPQAALRFKQGFGRLIRSKSDRGAVLILDSRVINKSYGKVFLKSLPECYVTKETGKSVLRKMEYFFEKGRPSG
ncbi:MAG: DEAD/DEAH box helicase family protein [Proteobacteria bacterium]|nr:DEAD/DEAH box helicase family protein [Pseudomonadota bacterium]